MKVQHIWCSEQVFSICCSIDLMVRDLMCEVGIIVKCTEEGLQIKPVDSVSF